MLHAILKPMTVAAMRLLFRLQSRGRRHVPRHGPVLLVAKHSSVPDPPLVGVMTPRPVSFLAKAERFAIPGLGAFIRRLNARPARREDANPGAFRTAIRLLQEGRALLVFPEGTRGEEEVLRPGLLGAGMLAVAGDARVVPVCIEGSGRAWPRGHRLPRPRRVTVTFGAPLRFAQADGTLRKESYEAASRTMMAAIAELIAVSRPVAPRRGGVGVVQIH